MRSRLAALFIFIALMVATPAALADTKLGNGTANFTVIPYVLSDIPLNGGDYCGNPASPQTLNFKLGLSGDKNTLDVRWDAKDPSGVIGRQIGVDCYLNCPATSNPKINCINYQSCSYGPGQTGPGHCDFNGPRYNYTADNVVMCRFYDPILPLLDLVVQNRTFKTVDYTTSTPPITVTVGSPATLPIDVKSYGLLGGYYTNNFTALQRQQQVVVSSGLANTSSATCGQVVRTFPTLNFLSATNIPFATLVHDSVDPTSCSSDVQCNYLSGGSFNSQCVAGQCWKRADLNINAGVASLPDFNIYGFFLVIGGATAVFFFARRKL